MANKVARASIGSVRRISLQWASGTDLLLILGPDVCTGPMLTLEVSAGPREFWFAKHGGCGTRLES
jgi:hypothetical protein